MKKMKLILPALIIVTAVILASAGCTGTGDSGSGTQATAANGAIASSALVTTNASTLSTISVEYKNAELETDWDDSDSTIITLNGDSVTFDGSGAEADWSTVTITSEGTYVVSGTLDNGQIIVNAGDDDKVYLILNGADITCHTSAPVYEQNVDKTTITLEEGTTNTVTDGTSHSVDEEGEPNAAIFSKDDLTINGDGKLVVNANYNNGIQSKDELKIVSGTIIVTAANDDIKGKDSVAIKDGVIIIDAEGDGIQSTNDEDTEKGYVVIEGGTIDITAGTDVIQAEITVEITGGDITISSGGGSVNSSSNSGGDWSSWGRQTTATSTDSAKGIKGIDGVIISGVTIDIDSSDDSIHSNNAIRIEGGTMILSSGDDGVHADSLLEINDVDMEITKSYEGLESAIITRNGGEISITASDDGINVAGGNDGSSVNGRMGRNEFAAVDGLSLIINDGYIYINASGDGLDSNVDMYITGGKTIVNGPMDYNGEFVMTGGYLLAVGSSGMVQAQSSSSIVNSVMITYSSSQSAGTLVHIESEDGDDVLTFSPAKTYESVLLCTSDLRDETTDVVYSGGSSTGTATDGLYSGRTYSGGSQYTTFTISGTVTYAGLSTGGERAEEA
jgi:hypothetical protein